MAEVNEIPIGELPMKEYKESRGKGITAVPGKAVAETDDEETETTEQTATEEGKEKPKSKGGFQKRIDRLIKAQSSLEEQLAAERKIRAELEAKANGTQETKKPVDGEPVRADFATDEEYIKAQARWEVKQELKEQREAEEKAADDERIKGVYKAYNDKLIEARSRIEDFDEVVSGSDAPIPQGVIMAIIEMDNGPDVAYYLGKHPDIRQELLDTTSLKAIGRAWKIAEELGGEGKSVVKESAEEKQSEKPKIKTKAPEPITPVSGGSTKSHVPISEMSMSEYKKARVAGRVS